MRIELFNDKAHVALTELLDRSKMWAIREGLCEPANAHEYLTLEYIDTCDSFLNHAQCYLENEEQIAADIFLWKLNRVTKTRRTSGSIRNAARQLARHTHIYLPSFKPLLRLTFLKVIAETTNYAELRRSGVTLLAAATLPGAIVDIRRELRRRGATSDSLLVPDDTYKRRMKTELLSNISMNV